MRSFCDWYAEHIYSHIANLMGRLTAPVPFALGEILMYLAALFVLATPVVLVICLVRKRRNKKASVFLRRWLKSFCITLAVFLFLYLFNWFIPLCGNVMGQAGHRTGFTTEELRLLRNYLVEQINTAAEQCERDENGILIFPEEEERYEQIAAAMQGISDEYPRLAGFYPQPKKALCSDVLDWMGIGGYTYPYTLEVTWNKYVTRLYSYSLLTHEQAHHKGFYKENEANFISYLACAKSGEPLLVYAGSLDLYSYITFTLYEELVAVYGKERAKEILMSQPVLSDLVDFDREQQQEEN